MAQPVTNKMHSSEAVICLMVLDGCITRGLQIIDDNSIPLDRCSVSVEANADYTGLFLNISLIIATIRKLLLVFRGGDDKIWVGFFSSNLECRS